VVLESGTAVTMPWLDNVSAVLDAWFAGSKGADAVANIIFADVNPSAKLPMTFPRSEADLPHPNLVIPPKEAQGHAAIMKSGEAMPTFAVTYDEGLKVGYKWYDAENKPVLFPFGFGLSYTTYAYCDLKVNPGKETIVTFMVKNTGSRAGDEIAQVYAALPASAGEPPKRLVGFSKIHLNPGESREVTVKVPAEYLSMYGENPDGWSSFPAATHLWPVLLPGICRSKSSLNSTRNSREPGFSTNALVTFACYPNPMYGGSPAAPPASNHISCGSLCRGGFTPPVRRGLQWVPTCPHGGFACEFFFRGSELEPDNKCLAIIRLHPLRKWFSPGDGFATMPSLQRR
jgi:hypothetical protein